MTTPSNVTARVTDEDAGRSVAAHLSGAEDDVAQVVVEADAGMAVSVGEKPFDDQIPAVVEGNPVEPVLVERGSVDDDVLRSPAHHQSAAPCVMGPHVLYPQPPDAAHVDGVVADPTGVGRGLSGRRAPGRVVLG
jgi:hypothetical protein